MGGTLVSPTCLRIAGASLVGVTHERCGDSCGDAWIARRTAQRADGGELLIACVCDGAGSARKGREGAILAAFAACGWFEENFWPALGLSRHAIGRGCLGSVTRLIRRAARSSGYGFPEYACTLVLVSVSSTGAWIAVHVGDGGIVGQFGERVDLVSARERGEYANETFFVTSHDLPDHTRVYGSVFGGPMATPKGFAVFSDGVEGSLVNARTGAVAPAICTMLDWLREHPEGTVAEALAQNIEDHCRERSGDDCTLVLLARLAARTEETAASSEKAQRT